ncbi:MAG TPA: hypothetical protein VKH44_11935 [Pirellulaceae bacterium]|nr:hypothetical protein [Pirellulaceae bacterium]
MSEISTEKRDQAMALIRLYCNRPFRDHGKRRSDGPYKGWHLHDWGHVVQRVYRMFYDLPLDIPSATVAAKPVRSEFPNRNDWEKRVHSARAQERMLELIEQGIAPFSVATAEQPAALVS